MSDFVSYVFVRYFVYGKCWKEHKWITVFPLHKGYLVVCLGRSVLWISCYACFYLCGKCICKQKNNQNKIRALEEESSDSLNTVCSLWGDGRIFRPFISKNALITEDQREEKRFINICCTLSSVENSLSLSFLADFEF